MPIALLKSAQIVQTHEHLESPLIAQANFVSTSPITIISCWRFIHMQT